MRKAVVKFGCDNCQKEITKTGDIKDFPYAEGWLENETTIYAFETSGSDVSKIHIKGDFCSKRCLSVFTNKALSGVVDNENPSPMNRPTPRPEVPPMETRPPSPNFDDDFPSSPTRVENIDPPTPPKKKGRFW